MKLRWYDENGFEVALDYEDYRDLRKENRELRKKIRRLENIIQDAQHKFCNLDDYRIDLINIRGELAKDFNIGMDMLDSIDYKKKLSEKLSEISRFDIGVLDTIIDDIEKNLWICEGYHEE